MSRFITVSLDKSIRIWDLATGQTVRVLRPPSTTGANGKINDAALSPDGETLASGGNVQDVQEWPYRIRKVTTEEVKAAAARYLVLDHATTGYLLPQTQVEN